MEEWYGRSMGKSTLDSFMRINDMAMGRLNGRMARNILVIGKKGKWLGMEFLSILIMSLKI